MVRIFRSVTSSSGFGMKGVRIEHRKFPLLTCNKICYGYLNNDWFMVFSNLVLLILLVALFLISIMHKGKGFFKSQ